MESVRDYEFNKKDLIGHGAFALVYKGRYKKKHEQKVAIKIVNKKNLGRSQTLLTKEIKILKELQHENIVRLYEFEENNHSCYLVMEYCNGGDLAEYLQDKGTLSEDTIRLFLCQISAAMKVLNEKGIVHRDLKPQNLLLSHKTSNPQPHEMRIKIADFGFARHLQTNMMAATLCGSPMYMAPEVITSQQYNAKADLWSIGTIIYQCLVGKAPFQANTPQALRSLYEKSRHLEPKIPSGTSEKLRHLLVNLLRKNVDKRMSFQRFFQHPFLTDTKTITSSPVPVPSRHFLRSVTLSGNSNGPSNDQRKTITNNESRECSPSEGDPLYLGISMSSTSSKDSEEYVIVSHHIPSGETFPSSPKRFNNSAKRASKGYASPQNRQQARVQRLSSPYLNRNNSEKEVVVTPGSGSPLTMRCGSSRSLSSRASDPDISPKSRPSPTPIPVPTQIENFEKIEQRSSLSSQGSNSPSDCRTKAMGESPRNSPRSPFLNSPSHSPSPRSLRKFKRSSLGSNLTGFSPIMENPSDLKSEDLEAYKKYPPSKLILPFNRAQTVPDLQTFQATQIANNMHKSQSGVGLSNEVIRLLFGKSLYLKHQSSTQKQRSDSLNTPPNSPCDQQALVKYNQGRNIFNNSSEVTNNNTILEQAKQFIPKDNTASSPHDVRETDHPFYISPLSKPESPGIVRNTSVPRFENYDKKKEALNSFLVSDDDMPELSEEDKSQLSEVREFHFFCKLTDCIDQVAIEHMQPHMHSFAPNLSESFATTQQDTFSQDPLHHVSTEQRQCEQMLLYLRSLQVLATALHTIRNRVKAGVLKTTKCLKQAVCELNKRYKKCCKLCQEAKKLCNIKANKQQNFKSADKILYFHAVRDCRSAALDEMFRGNTEECINKYKRALLLLEGVSLCTNSEADKTRLAKYKSGIDHRLRHLDELSKARVSQN